MKIKNIVKIILLIFTFTIINAQNETCLECHQEANFTKPDEETNLEVSLTVLPELFSKSVHGNLECVDCHSEGFSEFPHAEDAGETQFICMDCHDGVEEGRPNFKMISQEFEESVHYEKLEDKFTCTSCHNPHEFQLYLRDNGNLQLAIHKDNMVCLDCHSNKEKFVSLTKNEFKQINETHSFLPNQDLHWKKVRCIDCHAQVAENYISHAILGKEEAVNNCVECHSHDSRLSQTLYQFKRNEEIDSLGFLNSAFMNNSYVIGANRNYYLNYISVLIFIFTLFAIFIHGGLRFLNRNKKAKHAEVHREYFYPLWLRFWHWLNAILFLNQILTGIAMQYASKDFQFIEFSSAINLHNVGGVILSINYLLFFVGNLFSGNSKSYIPKLHGYFGKLIKQSDFYIRGIFKNEPHPFETTKKNKFNPLQQLSYVFIMYFFVVLIIITGWILLYPETIPEQILGYNGLFFTDILHTAIGFFLSLFMIGHMYLATTGTTVSSNIKAMINGWHE